MKAFCVSTRIRATPDRVWQILTDASRYPDWNTTVTKLEGRIAPGEKVTVHTSVNPGRAFPVKVTEFIPVARMVWSAGLPLGLFTGKRTFTLTPAIDGTVQFQMREEFTGLMAPVIGNSLPDLQPAFDEFASALKERAERGD